MIRFSKFVGTGNDFIFIDLTHEHMPQAQRLKVAQRICDRHLGVGADGIIFVERSSAPEKLKWDFYNRDGSQAEFCGNATRCFGRWALHYLKMEELHFESRIGDIRVLHKKDHFFTAELHGLTATPREIDIGAREFSVFKDSISKTESVYFVNTGVPHFVCETKAQISRAEKLQLVSAFRFHPSAGLAGANVTFLFEGETETFERGVEDFTLSCGTGVIAAAICVWRKQHALDVMLNTPGGPLRVEIVESKEGSVSKANLIGGADFICEGTFNFSEKK